MRGNLRPKGSVVKTTEACAYSYQLDLCKFPLNLPEIPRNCNYSMVRFALIAIEKKHRSNLQTSISAHPCTTAPSPRYLTLRKLFLQLLDLFFNRLQLLHSHLLKLLPRCPLLHHLDHAPDPPVFPLQALQALLELVIARHNYPLELTQPRCDIFVVYAIDRLGTPKGPKNQFRKIPPRSIFPSTRYCLSIGIRSDPASRARPGPVRVEASSMDRFLWESQVEAHFGSYFSGPLFRV